MREFFPIIASIIGICVIGAVEILLLYFLNRPWWQLRRVRWAAIGLPLFGIVAVLAWAAGVYWAVTWLETLGKYVAVLTFVCELALMASLPLSGIVHAINWLLTRIRVRHPKVISDEVDRKRRLFLKGAAAALPAATVTLGAVGVGHALGPVNVYRREIRCHNLPTALDGLRVLHLSDLHLGPYVKLSDVEQILDDASGYQPDLILITGDIADDLTLLAGALQLVAQTRPRLGAYASLGNHEHYRGLGAVRRIFDRSPVPLLIDESLAIQPSEGIKLNLAAVDDPRHMGADHTRFFQSSLEEAARKADPAAFSILMSHRPDAFHHVDDYGMDLTLSGHTHGAQFGNGERSILEPIMPKHFLWGHYTRGGKDLYTSAGVGHWFPFRLGCPQEAPVIVLRKA